jgi:hypothetical protein
MFQFLKSKIKYTQLVFVKRIFINFVKILKTKIFYKINIKVSFMWFF